MLRSSHTEWSPWNLQIRGRKKWYFNTEVMGLESASVDLLSEVFCFWNDMMEVMMIICGMLYCFGHFWNVIFIKDEVLYDGNLLIRLINCSPPEVTVSRLPVQFLPACSVLLYTMCIVLSVMIFLFNDHNKLHSYLAVNLIERSLKWRSPRAFDKVSDEGGHICSVKSKDSCAARTAA